MTHWHIRPNSWTSEDVATLQRLKAEGKSTTEIARVLGRSRKSINGKLEYMGLNDLQREERRQALRLRWIADGTNGRVRIHENGAAVTAGRPSDDLLRQRDIRLKTQHRSITSAFFGDPLPGHSALDKRGQA